MPGSLKIPTVELRDRVLLTVAEVCALTNMHQGTVYKLIHNGALVARRRGGRRLLITRADLDAYLARLPEVHRREAAGEVDPLFQKALQDSGY